MAQSFGWVRRIASELRQYSSSLFNISEDERVLILFEEYTNVVIFEIFDGYPFMTPRVLYSDPTVRSDFDWASGLTLDSLARALLAEVTASDTVADVTTNGET
jgi:hypothetical protein